MTSEDAGSSVLDVLEALGEDHPMAARLGDGALASATGVDLRLDDKPTGARLLLELHGHLVGLFGGGSDVAFLDGDAVLLEDGLALEFVEVHGGVEWGSADLRRREVSLRDVAFAHARCLRNPQAPW